MSYHRLLRERTVCGARRPAGAIVDYSGPLVPFLEPLDPIEHSTWIAADCGRQAGEESGMAGQEPGHAD